MHKGSNFRCHRRYPAQRHQTYKQWFGIELNEINRDSLYVPKGFAHGFITLQDKTEVVYLMSDFYVPGSDRGYRHDDPAFGIRWPLPINEICQPKIKIGQTSRIWHAKSCSFQRTKDNITIRCALR